MRLSQLASSSLLSVSERILMFTYCFTVGFQLLIILVINYRINRVKHNLCPLEKCNRVVLS